MKGFIVAIASWLCAAAPAFAGAVMGPGPTDGYGAQPTPPGLTVLDTHLSGSLPTSSLTAPALTVAVGVNDGIEFGVGSGLNFSSVGSTSIRTSIEAIYPWLRTSLPLQSETISTALMAGALIPVYNSLTEPTPGLTFLADEALGPLTVGENLGYALALTSGTHLASLNLHCSLPIAGVVWYEEQFITTTFGKDETGGVRARLMAPVTTQLSLDLTAAYLYNVDRPLTWSFVPSVGLNQAF